MRHVIYLLVMANIVFFLWNAIQGTTTEATDTTLPSLPPSVKPLVTLKERNAKEAGELDELTATEPPGAGIAFSCLTLGPFHSVKERKALEQRLHDSGYRPELHASEAKIIEGYWVYLPAMARDEAENITRMLKGKKDRDYYIGKDNLIALGAFKELSRAEIRLQEVRKYGLDPLLEPRYRTESVYWLDVDEKSGTDDGLQALLREYPGVRTQTLACK